MQQSLHMIPTLLSFPPTNITTEQIQKYLDENKKLIMAILENQNLGKLAECAQYQAILQKNLMYLAAIADAQPQPPPTSTAPVAMTPQAMTPHQSAMQPPPSYFMQQQTSPGMFPPRGPLQFGSPYPHQQGFQGHLGIRPMGLTNNNGLQHLEAAHVSNHTTSGPKDARGGKQDVPDVNQSGADGQGGSDAKK